VKAKKGVKEPTPPERMSQRKRGLPAETFDGQNVVAEKKEPAAKKVR
jgi:hypothetical protein